MKRCAPLLVLSLAALMLMPQAAGAAGISVDAGVTPARDRWIYRTLVRSMTRDDDPTGMGRKMDMLMWNNVLAYGMRPNLTLILKQPVRRREISMAGSKISDSGAGDLALLAKYRLVRRNNRETTFGLAGTLELTVPTGSEEFTSDTWDLRPGIYGSFRRGRWATDFSAAYRLSGAAGDRDDGREVGDELALDWAGARQFLVGGSANTTLAPVLELSYRNAARDELMGQPFVNSGEELLYLSPGLKYTRSSLILEALVLVPVWQDQNGAQVERGTGFLLGLRKLF
ncbi:MAG: transporter [Acidobacteria bacterium]|uniref:Transporter n=1 Tax=Candidatus Polarisedimenticola svalbardensis TaxID=2886004 RepID=A0A8J6Y112_9BACT|nr:transporter [Candidatus Polarisedimenticola svalbardensis]